MEVMLRNLPRKNFVCKNLRASLALLPNVPLDKVLCEKVMWEKVLPKNDHKRFLKTNDRSFLRMSKIILLYITEMVEGF